jgi:Uncharacterised nucleotidyltransferase
VGRRDAVRELLLSAARADSSDHQLAALVRDVEKTGSLPVVEEVARAHGVGPLLRTRLSRLEGFPEEHPDWLAADQVGAQARLLHTARTLDLMSEVLGAAPVVFKGPVLERWYGDRGLRTYSDVDVLVRRREFGSVLDRLVEAGFTELSANWRGFLTYEVAEVPLGHERTCVDLHWDLVALGSARRDLRLDAEAMAGRAETVTVAGVDVRTFDPIDTLIHLCVTGGLEGGRRLSRLVDVDRVVRGSGLDWAILVERATAGRVRALCAGVLARSRRLLGTPVPAEWWARLSPYPGWGLANELVGERRRRASRLTRGVGSGFVLSTGRDSVPATWSAGVAGVGENLRTRWGQRGLTDPGGPLDWQTTSETPAADRARYLDWVEGG